MSLVIDPVSTDPVHTPRRRDVFQFDEEVASIFENMAIRSIPMYAETHRMHASLAKDFIEAWLRRRGVSGNQIPYILDIGASTGVFFKMLNTVIGDDARHTPSDYVAVAVDTSEAMLSRLSTTMPWVTDALIGADSVDHLGMQFAVINVSYTLQFLDKSTREAALQSIAKAIEPGGLLLVSQKYDVGPAFGRQFTQEYIQFRKDNGYSDEEIESKTRALKGSMWVEPINAVESRLSDLGFYGFTTTTSWGPFTSFACLMGP